MAVNYLKSQGLRNDSADVATLMSIMMKMQMGGATGKAAAPRTTNVGSSGRELPGGLHRIPEMEPQGEDSEMSGVDLGNMGEL